MTSLDSESSKLLFKTNYDNAQSDHTVTLPDETNCSSPRSTTRYLYTIQTPQGFQLTATNYGCRVISLLVPKNDHATKSKFQDYQYGEQGGEKIDVVIGYSNPSHFSRDDPNFGAIIGRVGNRTKVEVDKQQLEMNKLIQNRNNNLNLQQQNLKLQMLPQTLAGEAGMKDKSIKLVANEASCTKGNHIHGGVSGFGDKMWQVKELNTILDSDGKSTTQMGSKSSSQNLGSMTTLTYQNQQCQLSQSQPSEKDSEISLQQQQYLSLSQEQHEYDYSDSVSISESAEFVTTIESEGNGGKGTYNQKSKKSSSNLQKTKKSTQTTAQQSQQYQYQFQTDSRMSQSQQFIDKSNSPNALEFSYISENGEEGYPGRLLVKVRYELFSTPIPIVEQNQQKCQQNFSNRNNSISKTVSEPLASSSGHGYGVTPQHVNNSTISSTITNAQISTGPTLLSSPTSLSTQSQQQTALSTTDINKSNTITQSEESCLMNNVDVKILNDKCHKESQTVTQYYHHDFRISYFAKLLNQDTATNSSYDHNTNSNTDQRKNDYYPSEESEIPKSTTYQTRQQQYQLLQQQIPKPLTLTQPSWSYINLTSHIYFNLSGSWNSEVQNGLPITEDHEILMPSSTVIGFCPTDQNLIPNGKIIHLGDPNSPEFDLSSQWRRIGDGIEEASSKMNNTNIRDYMAYIVDISNYLLGAKQIQLANWGYDHHFVINPEMQYPRTSVKSTSASTNSNLDQKNLKSTLTQNQNQANNTITTAKTGPVPVLACSVRCKSLQLDLYTTEPGFQFYTGNHLSPDQCLNYKSYFSGKSQQPQVTGKKGALYQKHAGFCLETQNFPNCINNYQYTKTKSTGLSKSKTDSKTEQQLDSSDSASHVTHDDGVKHCDPSLPFMGLVRNPMISGDEEYMSETIYRFKEIQNSGKS